MPSGNPGNEKNGKRRERGMLWKGKTERKSGVGGGEGGWMEKRNNVVDVEGGRTVASVA